MKKKHLQPKESVRDFFRNSFAGLDEEGTFQPLLHINCRGFLEVENCSAVLDYSETKIELGMGNYRVAIEGRNLIIRSLNPHILEVSGTVVRILFPGEEMK